MTHPNPSTALARVVVDELANQGVGLVVIAPGSRSAALAIAAAEHPDLETRVVIDERSAAFHALGVARGTGTPAAVLTTSGTAAANLFPAVVEADTSCVPLIAVTADRPAEMQGVGANQTIDQVRLYGDKVRGYAGIEAPLPDEDGNRSWREVVATLLAAANGLSPGPAHLNVRFSEPTVPVGDDGRSRSEPYRFATPRSERPAPPEREWVGSEDLFLSGERGLVIAGDGYYDRTTLLERAARLGWPVLATALSGIRGRGVIGTYHHLLASGVPDEFRPDTVVAVGSVGPSARLESLIASATRRIRVDAWGRRLDPGRNATDILSLSPVDLLDSASGTADVRWSESWHEAEHRCRSRMDEILGSAKVMSGAGVVAALNGLDWECLVVASSLPIRDVDAHLTKGGAVFANRGASGIDGFISSALGVASVRAGTIALAGDLSLLHDSNGFLHDGDIDLTVVVIDNGGGGIFDSLPQARHAPDYERLFVTNPERSLEALARFHGLRFAEAKDTDTIRRLAADALGRPGVDLIRVEVDRSDDLRIRAQLEG